MKELRVAVKSDSRNGLIEGLHKAIDLLEEGHGSIPHYNSNGNYVIRFVIIDDGEYSYSLEELIHAF